MSWYGAACLDGGVIALQPDDLANQLVVTHTDKLVLRRQGELNIRITHSIKTPRKAKN
jgi:hypothetical protein